MISLVLGLCSQQIEWTMLLSQLPVAIQTKTAV